MKKKTLPLLAVILSMSCMKSVDSPIGNTLYNWKLSSYKGPDSGWKWLKPADTDALSDDGIRFTARQVIEKVNGQDQWVNKYTGTIYQGAKKYWPTKPDFTFETTYINDTTFKLGNDQSGFNIAYFNGAGETLRIVEKSPVDGREYIYEKASD